MNRRVFRYSALAGAVVAALYDTVLPVLPRHRLQPQPRPPMRPRDLSEATKPEISRAHPVVMEVLPAWLQRHIGWDRSGPWCTECGRSMPQQSRDRGEFTHPVCGPLEVPNPLAAQGLASPLTGRMRGQEAARRERELSTGPDRPSRSSREERLMQPRVPPADDTRGPI